MCAFPKNKVNAISKGQRKLVYGVGVNDADYLVYPRVNGKKLRCPYYARWVSMLARTYSEKYREKQPTYKNCTVSEEWKTFSKFRKWMVEQDWVGNHLDKDFINPGNKHYSKETCVFIPQALNSLLNNSEAARGEYPQGVHFHKQTKKFQAEVRYKGKSKYLGIFNSPQEAEKKYILAFNIKLQGMIDNNTYPFATKYLHKHFK